MAGNLQYRLYNASIAPPGDAWAKIAEELDEEPEHRLSQRMQEATLTPPIAAWQNILEALNESSPEKAKVIPISRKWMRIAAAAIVAGIIVVAGLNYFMSDTGKNDTTKHITLPQNNSASDKTNSTQTPSATNNSSAVQPATAAIARTTTARPIAIASMGFSPRIRHSRVQNVSADNTVNTDGVTGTQASLLPKAYIAPQAYLTVAAPNGQPAKISARFTDAVTLVMINTPPDNMNTVLKSISWKQRVGKWCDKLMMNAGFIPAGTNFLDIVELEQLLNE